MPYTTANSSQKNKAALETITKNNEDELLVEMLAETAQGKSALKAVAKKLKDRSTRYLIAQKDDTTE
jgi:hypothetical protein